MRNNIPVVHRIQQDIYWHKVLQLCEATTAMIRCYESKKAELNQKEWVDYVRVFENLGGSIDRVIMKYGILVGAFDEDMEELEKMQAKIAAVLLVANKKLKN
jgi:hypothetical protein